MKSRGQKILSMALSVAMLFSMTGMNTVFAAEGGPTVGASGLCEHHPAHTDECGYTEGTPEVPCTHEHRSECYKEVTECVHKHTDECYGDEIPTATGSDAAEPTNCAHSCDRENGCVTEELDCQHRHDGDCGYGAAVSGTPCAFVCEECAKDSGEQNPPPADNALVQIITGFAGFDGSEPLDTITVTEKSTVAAIGLPETLEATVDGVDGETAIPVMWECAEDYEATEYESYDFTPVWDADAYALAGGVAAPVISVFIRPQGGLQIALMSAGDYNAGDIAVVNAIIEQNGLNWTKADPADGASVPGDWTGVTWTDDAAGKRISELDLSGQNQAGALDVSGLTGLRYLYCNSNQLTSLDVSGLSALSTLFCRNNQLTSLNSLPASLKSLSR